MSQTRRILILAPHPDDEIVACGVAARRERAAGARVFVLYLTTGVPSREAVWPWQRARYAARLCRRREEAEAAAALFGLEPIGFLDIPSRQLRHHLDAAMAEIAKATAGYAPDELWITAFEGAHQDHDAANALGARFAARLTVREFAAYNFAGGRVHSNRFPVERPGTITIELTAEEAALKRQALACFSSEQGNLRHIGLAHESWRPLPTHDYAAPPHPGRLFRERFHWVPFRHPRVDFDGSRELYDELGRWASAAGLPRQPALDNRPGGEPREPDREFAGALDEAEGEGGLRG